MAEDQEERPGRLTIWDVGAWKKKFEIDEKAILRAVAFTQDGAQTVSCNERLRVQFRWTETGKARRPIRVDASSSGWSARDLAFSPDGRLLAIDGESDRLIMFDLQDKRRLWEESPGVTAVAFAPDGSSVVSGQYDGAVRVWDAHSGKRLHLFRTETKEMIVWTGFSWDGRCILASGPGGAVWAWDRATGSLLAKIRGRYARAAAISPDSRLIVCGNSDQTIRGWELDLPAAAANAIPEKPAASRVAPHSLRPDLVEKVKQANRHARRHSQPPPFDLLRVKEFAEAARISVRLHPRRGRVADVAASKLGGTILWPKAEPWPLCEVHGQPLLPVAQLTAADFPETPFPRRTDLMQVLWCPADHAEAGYAPLPRIFWRKAASIRDRLKRMPASENVEKQDYVVCPCRLNPERVIEFPHGDEFDTRLRTVLAEVENEYTKVVDYFRSLGPATGWKVGGWIDWIHWPKYPVCDSCGKPMQHLLTISSSEWNCDQADRMRWLCIEERDAYQKALSSKDVRARLALQMPADIMIGDMGNEYLFICYDCDPSALKAVSHQ